MAEKDAEARPKADFHIVEKPPPLKRVGSSRSGKKTLIAGNPGNSGGKKGRSGRKPTAYKQWFQQVMESPEARQRIWESLTLPGCTENRNYGVILKTALAYAYGQPVATVDVTTRKVIARFPEPVASVDEWKEKYGHMVHTNRTAPADADTPN